MNIQQFIQNNLLNSVGKLNSRKISHKWFVRHGFEAEWNELLNHYPDFTMAERVNTLLHGEKLCPTCGFIIRNHDRVYCSQECDAKSSERKERTKTNFDPIKRKNLMIKKYGVASNFHRKEVQDSIKSNLLEKHGVTNVSQLEEVKKKKSLHPHFTTIDGWKLERNKKCLDERGIDYSNASDKNIESLPLKMNDKSDRFIIAWLDGFSHVKSIHDPILAEASLHHRYTLLHNFGLSHLISDGVSQTHRHVLNILDENNITYKVNDREIIKPKEIDVVIPEFNIGIEINGSYWHREGKVDKNYHQDKVMLCHEKGIKLLSYFEWTDLNQFMNVVLNLCNKSKPIHARHCTIKELDAKEARSFLDNNHIQGFRASTLYYGLYHNNQLIQLLSLGKAMFSNHDWEIHRFCTQSGYRVNGGLSKLWNRFIKDFDPKSCISYSSLQLGITKLYENIGFTETGVTQPSYYWVNRERMLSRYQAQKHRLKDILEEFDPNLSEGDNMVMNGFMRIHDCGNQRFEYNALH